MKPNRKLKKPDTCSKLILDEIIGLTCRDANGLASSTSNSSFVYIAGCVVVVYNTISETQLHLMVSNRSPKPLSCVAASQGGNVVAAGESGHQPAVLVWDCKSMTLASELKGHQCDVACMAFSPDGKHLVSVGFPQDGYLCLWDWRSRILVTKIKACSSCSAVESVSFSADTKFIVTAGKKHFKIWNVKSSTRSRAKVGAGSLTMHVKTVNLGRLKGCSFTSVTSPTSITSIQAGDVLPIFALTDSGVLCLLTSELSVANAVDIEVEKGFALSASSELIACACNNGLVKLFTIDSLKYVRSLQHSEAKTCNKENASENEVAPLPPTYPDAVACQFSTSRKLVVIYSDRSLYIWDIHDDYKATKCCVLVSHSGCIWDIKNLSCENMHDPSIACVARGCPGGVSFATCSADGTIRLWDLALQPFLVADTFTEPIAISCLVSAGIFERESVVSGASAPGFRAMSASSDGKYLAAGDCVGNLHIYNLQTSDYICIQDAHNAEILSLSFSSPVKKFAAYEQVVESHYLLASGGKDCKIHLYDVERNFTLIGSVEDHSAAVSSVKLSISGCKILSCSVDTSLVLHDVSTNDNSCNISRSHIQLTNQGTIFDMAVDPMMEVAVIVGKDKKVEILNIAAGKLIRSFKQDGDFGDPIKVGLDPSSSYIVCSYSNKSICIYDFMTGEMVARGFGHGEVTTGLIFLPDCKHIVSVGGDGCVFVWKLPDPLCSGMLQKIKENSSPLSPMVQQAAAICQIKIQEEDEQLCKTIPNTNQLSRKLCCTGGGFQETSNFKFSISRLPKWAQEKVTSSNVSRTPSKIESHTPARIDSEGSKHFSCTMSRSAVSSENNQNSPMTEETCRTFALDKRWLTIHTVCLDLLNSPDVWDMKGMKQPLTISNMSQDAYVVTKSDAYCTKHLSGDCSENISSVGSTVPLNTCECDEVSERLKSEGFNSKAHTTMDIINAPNMESQDNDVLDMDLNNSSTKLKIVEMKSSARRRSYSTRFVVRRDLLRDHNIDTPIRDSGGETMNCTEDAQALVELQRASTKQEDIKNSDITNAKGEEERGVDETIIACREALLNLDASTESALALFSKLGKMDNTEESSRELEARLYAEANEMLPSIAKKVHAVAKLAQSNLENSSGEMGVDHLGFEPLLGTFAESLSQRVVEILKKNSSTL